MSSIGYRLMIQLTLLDGRPVALAIPTVAELAAVKNVANSSQAGGDFEEHVRHIGARLDARSPTVAKLVSDLARRVNVNMLSNSGDAELASRATSLNYEMNSDQPALVARAAETSDATDFYRRFFGKEFSADPLMPTALAIGEFESQTQFVGGLYAEELALRRKWDVYPGAIEALKTAIRASHGEPSADYLEHKVYPYADDIVHLRAFAEDGRRAEYFLRAEDRAALESAIGTTDSIDLEDFGTLLASNYSDVIYEFKRRLVRGNIYKVTNLYYKRLDETKYYLKSFFPSGARGSEKATDRPIGANETSSGDTDIRRKLDEIDAFAAQHPGEPVSGEIRRLLLSELTQRPDSEPVGANARATLPSKAPALWASDKKLGDTPPDFINRHYAPWLGKGLARPDIKRLDPQLYVALANWLRHNEMPSDLDLPTLKEKNDRWADRILGGRDAEAGEVLRAAEALRSRARRSR